MTALLIGLMASLLLQGVGGDEAAAFLDRERVALGECVVLTIKVSGNGAADCEVTRFPKVDGLFAERYMTLMLTEDRQISAESGGERRPVLVTSYFYRLYALEPGTFTIPPVEITVRGNRRLSTGPLTLTFADTGGAATGAAVEVVLDTDRVRYVHEAVAFDVSVRIPEGAEVHGLFLPWLADRSRLIRLDVKDPGSEDLSVRALPIIRPRGEEAFFYSGDGALFRRDVMLPREAGDHSWEPAFVAYGEIDPLSGGGSQGPMRYALCPVPGFRVEALPAEGRPPIFTNSVGRFEIDALAEPRSVRVGDSIMLRLEVTGRGNNEFIEFPDHPGLAGSFRIFGMEEGRQDEDGWPAYLLWRTIELSPLSAAVEEIPALAFSFFDPGEGRYRIIETPRIPLEVLPAEGGTAHEPADRKLAGDIATIYTSLPGGHAWVGTALPVAYWALGGICIAAILLAWAARMPAVRAAAVERRKRQALARFLGGLDRIRDRADDANALSGLARLFGEYVAARFDLPPGDVLAGDVKARLATRGAPESVATAVEKFMIELDAQRFRRGEEKRSASASGAAAHSITALCTTAAELARGLSPDPTTRRNPHESPPSGSVEGAS